MTNLVAPAWSATALVAALAASLLATAAFVRLADRYGWGKSVRRDGPRGHLVKEGTPTMGGVAFLVCALASALIVSLVALGAAGPSDTAIAEIAEMVAETGALALLTAGAAAIGLLDDLLALRRKRRAARGEEASTGLLARYRLLLQGAVALAFAAWAAERGATMFGAAAPIWLDVAGLAFVVVGTINALNFTDGLDGLAAGVAAIILLLFVGSPLAAATIGALLGFLAFNAHPARVFMGGVGSEALGALIAGYAIVGGAVWYLPLLAAVPLLEVVSVLAQVGWFRATGGKRLLKMSPLHHHFELSGWSEVQVVARFWIATAAAAAAVWGLRAAFGPFGGGPA